MDFIYDWLSQFQPQGHTQVTFNIFVAVAMIFALLNTFLGFKLTKLWATLIGVLIGFAGGFALGEYIWHNSGVALICALVLAVAIGAVAFLIYKAGVFLMCGAAAFGLAYLLLDAYVDNQIINISVAAIVGILVGIISILLMRPFIIITTALGGGFSFANSLFTLLPPSMSEQQMVLGLSLPILIVGAAVAVIGIVVQFITTKKRA